MSPKTTASDPLLDNVREAFIEAAPGPGQVSDAAAQACYGYLLSALEGADDPTARVQAAISGLMEGAKKLTAPFWHVARGGLVGVLHAGIGQRLDLDGLIDAATTAAMDGADAAGGDFGAAAQGAVEGCILGANELSLDDQALGSRAATAALTHAQGMAEGAFPKIQHLVTRRVGGVTITVPSHLR